MKKLLKYVGLAESSYYFQPKKNPRKGMTPSKVTRHKKYGWVTEDTVVEAIKEKLSHEFIDCGYRIMTEYLKRDGYIINHKKVYRIMSTHRLLKADARIKRSGSGRKFVLFRKVNTQRPLQCIEMDIKMVWIPQKGKNAYLLSVIDVHTRKILGDYFAFSIKKKEVISLLSKMFDEYQFPEGMVVRSDNGSQFIALEVRDFIQEMGFSQEFTHVATPEENAHIEAYHGTLKRDVFDRFEYSTFPEIQQILERYVKFYNNERLHGRLGKITPQEMWEKSQNNIKTKINAA